MRSAHEIVSRSEPQKTSGQLKAPETGKPGNEFAPLVSAHTFTHLDALESESIHIMREVAAECKNPALLFSGGKDSIVMLRLAEKAFRPCRFPFPLVHIDTEHNFPEVIATRDKLAAGLGERLIVRSLDDSIRKGSIVLKSETQSRNAFQSVTLLETIAEFGFDACMGGARRDEEKARAKERIFSFRDEFGQWDPKNQRPELWDIYNTRVHQGENIRVFPISNWTEMDIWQYIEREKLEIPEHLLRPRTRGDPARGRHHAGERTGATLARRKGDQDDRAFSYRRRHYLHLPGGIPCRKCAGNH